ncbi:MAG: type I DNA topoisomerase [Deltaproteobacteria bacterium]|nr:type I DNA topoisomerase [Deltaproteobacteria bacterium]
MAKKESKEKHLVIVESPAKARTINRYLGSDYVVMASVGHVRDLPSKNPKGIKDPVPGVDLENDFTPTYQVIKGKGKTVRELKLASEKAKDVWLATDLDREGEAIAWHLVEALGLRMEGTKRVVFNAITKNEIENAFQNPRTIDMNKVNAQQARRILDRIVGYQVSPLLWKKVGRGLSAGRVQSVAVRLLVEREREIESFVPEEYWKITGYFCSDLPELEVVANQWEKWVDEGSVRQHRRRIAGRTIQEKNEWLYEHGSLAAELIEIDGERCVIKDSDQAIEISRLAGFHLDKSIMEETSGTNGHTVRSMRLVGHISGSPVWHVKSIKTKRTTVRPFSPFITSTLQQSAANQLGFTAQTTMRTAQALYEGINISEIGHIGLITYMRTDSTHLSSDAIKMARDFISKQFGDNYLPAKPNIFVSSNKSAQEAHEAIRPTDITLTPDKIRTSLNDQQYKLYKIIWERFVACQMAGAQWDNTAILINGSAEGRELLFKASGRTLVFDGYHKVLGYSGNSEDALLPKLQEKQPVGLIQIDTAQHFTSPPPRYTEASLIKKLESEGIGRPSTYAQIIQVIQFRKYTEKVKGRFYATDLGKVVTDKLIEAFPTILEIGYTRYMEQQLDNVEDTQADWIQMLRDFYGPFKKRLERAFETINHAKAETQPAPHKCPDCGSSTVYRFGRNGRFLSCSAYPECKYASPIDREGNPVSPEQTDIACPKCQKPMLLKKGRFGPFLSCLRYPECDGILNLDRKGGVSLPKTPPLLTDLKCPKCSGPLNLRRSAKGPWLSCSKFPKCRGRMGWSALDEKEKAKWEKLLDEHEKKHPQATILRLDGEPLAEGYQPQVLQAGSNDVSVEVEEF